MNISDYQYINITEITGNTEMDVTNFLLQNHKYKTLEHLIGVANTNKEIAQKYNLDKKYLLYVATCMI